MRESGRPGPGTHDAGFGRRDAVARSVLSALHVELEFGAEDHPVVVYRVSGPVAHEYYPRARDLWKTRKADNVVRADEV